MWPFRKKPVRYSTTSLQVGDECVCVDDRPHAKTHQQLLTKGERYIVRDVSVGRNADGYGGPFIRLVGVLPTQDMSWDCVRFEKAVRPPPAKESIVEAVSKPAGLNVEKEREEAY